MHVQKCQGPPELYGIFEIHFSDLEIQAQALLNDGISSSTRATYSGPQKVYIAFCRTFSLQSLPASDDTFRLFITHLFNKGLSFNTIKLYVSAIISLHTFSGVPPPNLKNPKFRLMMRSIAQKCQGHGQKSPLTMKLLRSIWSSIGNMPEAKCLCAAVTLGFFGGLRGAEYLASRFSQGPKMSQLTFINKAFMKFKVTKSKTKKSGFTKHYHCSRDTICAVCCMIEYLSYIDIPPSNNQPLFCYKGKTLSKSIFNSILKQAVKSIGRDPTKYSIHSLRSGMATTAACNQFEDWEIKKLGGWVSNSYLTYIRINPLNSKRFSQRLTTRQAPRW